MTVQKRPHYEERIAHANGALIDYFDGDSWLYAPEPSWHEDTKFRVNPKCEYAIEEIRKLGGDEAVENYFYWLGGGELEFKTSNGCWIDTATDNENPFNIFTDWVAEPSSVIHKKKRAIKQVLWVYVCADTGVAKTIWVKDSEFPEILNAEKTKFTREVEA